MFLLKKKAQVGSDTAVWFVSEPSRGGPLFVSRRRKPLHLENKQTENQTFFLFQNEHVFFNRN